MSETLRLTRQQVEELFNILKKVNGKWKNKSEASRKLGISRPTIDKVLSYYPDGLPKKTRLTIPLFVSKYEETSCHKKIVARYTDKATGQLSQQGEHIDRMGLNLFLMAEQHDPLTMDKDFFLKARNDPRFIDAKTGDIRFDQLSSMRMIMSLAGIDPKAIPEMTTKGTKREPRKKLWYLDETELLRFIAAIDETDTLVLARIGFESGGRFSSTSMVTSDKISYDQNMIEMREPKVSQTEERYFVPCTLDFIRTFIRDESKIGRLFKRFDNYASNYESYKDDMKEAGLRAGLWRYTGKKEAYGRLTKAGKTEQLTKAETEGKVTTTHLLKHTFVSLASMHGFGLDDVSEQTGTEPATLKQFYLGVGKKKLKAVILGRAEFTPWADWISKELDPYWKRRYAELRKTATEVTA